jgi:hypothetical protein
MNRRLFECSALLALAALVAPLARAAEVNVPRTITTDTTWTADNTYFISGYTFVVSPAVLTIRPGTVVKGRQKGGGSEAAALVITQGAKLMAVGSPTQPIIFTSELDQLNGNLGPADTNLWGGLVVLGKATLNSRADSTVVTAPITDQIEGFAVAAGETALITYGGTDDADNSGVIRYVSIRHGGDVLGTANEINGLTLGGVGSGTTIDHVEVFANKDDGVEFFGGTVDLRYYVGAFGKDDGIDYDQGWRGRVQFALVLGSTSNTEAQDKGGEWDGSTAPLNATPVGGSSGLYNLTFIGNGAGSINNTALNIRDNATAKVYNSVFLDYNNMIDLENDVNVDASGNPVAATTARITFENNVWWSHVSANNNAAGFNARPAGTNAAFTEAFFTTTSFNNTIANPALVGVSRTDDGTLDPRPGAGSPALTGPFATVPADGWLAQTNFKGAFAPSGPTWLQGWTKLSSDGYLNNLAGGVTQEFINISTRCNVGTGDNVAIVGFIISGSYPKTVLIRLVGKPLEAAPFNLTGVLQDPTIELYSGSTVIGANDNWGTNANAAQIEDVSVALGIGLYPIHDNDAALLVTLAPGAYTVIGRGAGSTSGVAIMEAYAAD